MTTKQYIMILGLALIGGVIGGTLSGRLLSRGPVQTPEDVDPKKVMVANEFHLVDVEGKDRWVLALSKEGEPNITFINKYGWAPMAIGMNKQGFPFFNMILEPRKGGSPSIVLMDSAMENRAVLGLRQDGEPFLSFLDETGKICASVGGVELKNPLTGSSEKRPCASLVLFDEHGEVIWSAPQVVGLPVQFSKRDKSWR